MVMTCNHLGIFMARSVRQAISLKPEVYAAISEIATLTNITKTTVIASILDDMLPMLQKTAVAIRKAQQGKDEIAISLMMDLVDEAEQKFKSAQIELNDIGGVNGNK